MGASRTLTWSGGWNPGNVVKSENQLREARVDPSVHTSARKARS